MNIAIHGKCCSGKSTVARILHEQHGFTQLSLAEPIRAAVSLSRLYIATNKDITASMQDFLLGLTDPDTAIMVYPDWLALIEEHKNTLLAGTKPRGFMQSWGTLIREYDEDCFPRAVLESADDRSCVDDLRMKNEAWLFEDNGWMLVKLQLPEETRLERVEKLYPDQNHLLNHATECDLDDFDEWDYVLETDCPKEEMPQRVQQLVDSLS